MRARVVAITALAALAITTLVVISGGNDHTLRAAFDSAVQVVPGQEVRVAGRKVGSVASVEETNGDAILELRISDERSWPLHRGTTARLRWGSTSSYALRYVELHPGPSGSPALLDGGLLPRAQTVTPVELDQVYRIFRGRGHADLGTLVDELGQTFGGRSRQLAHALRDAPDGVDHTAEVLREVGADQAALRRLIVAGAGTTSALASRDRQLRQASGHAARTFDVVAARAVALRSSIERLPSTLESGRSTLGRLDRSLVGLRALVGRLAPGAVALRTMAPVAEESLAELRTVAPLAAATLRTGRRAAPAVTRLLRVGTPFMPRLGEALDRLAPMVGCLRPYGPEVAGFLSTWTGFTKNYDAQGHFVRAFFEVPPIPVGGPLDSEQAVDAHGGSLHYAMPRPPGLNAGQPWFQPQCGAGPDAIDPGKDPERRGPKR